MKWINESNVEFDHGNHEPCIFKFDNSKVWFMFDVLCSTHTVRTEARKLGQAYGAKEITIKHLWEGYKITESRENVVNFSRYDGKYNFYIPLTVKNGERRKFKDFDDSELFA